MENSTAQKTDPLSLATQSVSSTTVANNAPATNVDSKKCHINKKKPNANDTPAVNTNWRKRYKKRTTNYKLQCYVLLKQCEVIQQDNERIVHRIQQVAKQLSRSRVERKFLEDRLDKYQDNWREVGLQIDLENEWPTMETDNLKMILN